MTARVSVVLLHGWGATARVWDDAVAGLAGEYDLLPLNLPGHGESCLSETSLPALALELVGRLERKVSGRVVLLGWSLGGLLAMQVAMLRPERVRALLLVAATPVFVRQEGWDAAMPAEEFDDFCRLYEQHPEGAWRRFIALQAQGDANGRQVIRELKSASASRESPLKWGLDCLRTSNLLADLNRLQMPVRMLFGKEDRLVPRQAAVCLADRFGIHTELWLSAAHAPFLSCPEKFTDWVRNCLLEESVHAG